MHTAGPWTVRDDGERGLRKLLFVGVARDEAYDICVLPLLPNGPANARLIAAAPDSHEANKSSLMVLCALRDAQPWTPPMLADIDFAIEANRAALAKVKGAPLSSGDDGPPHPQGQQNEGAES